MEHIWNVSGREYYFDVSDSECMKKLNHALTVLCGECGEGEAITEVGGTIEHHCRMIGDFFDNVFSEGAGTEICGQRHSAEQYTLRYVDFIVFVNRQVEAFSKLCRSIEDKYLGTLESISEASA